MVYINVRFSINTDSITAAWMIVNRIFASLSLPDSVSIHMEVDDVNK